MIIDDVPFAEARAFVAAHHYLGTLPSSVRTNLGTRGGGWRAIASYGPVHSAKSPPGWLELRRLVRDPSEHDLSLSQFLAATLRRLKADKVPAVLSWADPAAGHHGGIYQATNWIYTEPYSYNWNSHFRLPDGSVVDHRRAFKMFGTSSRAKVLAERPDWVAFLPAPKMRYLMPLAMKREECLRLLRAAPRPYPKPDRDGATARVDRRKEFKLAGVS